MWRRPLSYQTGSVWLSTDQKDGHLTISAARPLSKSSRLELVTSLELPFYKSSSVSCRIPGESCSCSLKFTLKFLTSCSVSCEIRTVPYDKCVWRQLSGQRMLVHHLPLLFCMGLRVSAHHLPSFANLSNKSDKGFALGRKPIRGSAPGMANNADWMTLYGIRRRRYGFW